MSENALGAGASGAAHIPASPPPWPLHIALPRLRDCSLLSFGAAITAAASLVAGCLATEFRFVQLALLAACAVLLTLSAFGYRQVQRQLAGDGSGAGQYQQLAELSAAIAGAFGMAVDAKNHHPEGHTERVRDIALLMGQKMGLSRSHQEALRMAAMLRDTGMLAIPDSILAKPTKLSMEEYRKVQTHAAIGATLLESVPFPWPVVPIVRGHHERYDGTGYPDGLAGDQIPLGARILAVADAHESILSPRPYRPARTRDGALSEIKSGAGTQFDPWVVETFLAIIESSPLSGEPVFTYHAEPDTSAWAGGTADRASVFLDMQQANQELFALYEIVQTMGRSLAMQETIDLVISKTKKITDFAACALFLRQEDEASIVAASAAGVNADLIRGRRLPLGVGVSGMVAQTGEPSGLGRAARDDLVPLLGPEAEDSSLRHVLSAPLGAGLKAIGALSLYRTGNRPFTGDDARLVTAVASQAAIAIDNASKYEQTRQNSLSDQLTGLANARYFFLELEQEMNRAQRQHRPVSLVAVDLNDLKGINDTYGHQQGDRALRAIGDIFRRQVRDYDTVVRYAGDEFFIILPSASREEAAETLSRIRAAVADSSLEIVPGRRIKLSASFGAATFPDDAQSADALIAAADQAMYAEKREWQRSAGLDAGPEEETHEMQPRTGTGMGRERAGRQ